MNIEIQRVRDIIQAVRHHVDYEDPQSSMPYYCDECCNWFEDAFCLVNAALGEVLAELEATR